VIRSLARCPRAFLSQDGRHKRWVTGAVSMSLVVALLDVAATPTLAYRASSVASVDLTADDPSAPAPLEVLAPPDASPSAPSADDAPAQPAAAAQTAGRDTAAQPASNDAATQPAGDDTAAQPASADATTQPAGDDTAAQPTGDGAAAQPAADAVDPCAAPYDRPELACILSGGAITSGSVSPATGISVYRYDAALPGTIIQAQLTNSSAHLALFLVGPGDKVLSEADAGSNLPQVVGATVQVPGTHAIYVVADPSAPGGADASYTLQFLAQPPVPNTDVPLLPGSDATPPQCPQARIEAADTFFTRFMTIFDLPCQTCTITTTTAPKTTTTQAPSPPTAVPSTARASGALQNATGGCMTCLSRVGQPGSADTQGKSSTSQPSTSAASESQPTSSGGSTQSAGQSSSGSTQPAAQSQTQSQTTPASGGATPASGGAAPAASGSSQSAAVASPANTTPSASGGGQPSAPAPPSVPVLQPSGSQAVTVNAPPASPPASQAGQPQGAAASNASSDTGKSPTAPAVQTVTPAATPSAGGAPTAPGGQVIPMTQGPTPRTAVDAGQTPSSAPNNPASPAPAC
jgi:hypothetical protein